MSVPTSSTVSESVDGTTLAIEHWICTDLFHTDNEKEDTLNEGLSIIEPACKNAPIGEHYFHALAMRAPVGENRETVDLYLFLYKCAGL